MQGHLGTRALLRKNTFAEGTLAYGRFGTTTQRRMAQEHFGTEKP